MPVCRVDFADFLTQEGYFQARSNVLAVMLYPRDADARKTFIASTAVKYMRSRAGKSEHVVISMMRDGVELREPNKLLTEAMSPVVRKAGTKGEMKTDDPYSGPNVAADILMRAWLLADEGRHEEGILKILEAQSKEYSDRGLTGGGREKLRATWEMYRPIAHISLALRAVDRLAMSADPSVFLRWIGLSQYILQIGCNIHNRFADPILRLDESWQIASTPEMLGKGVTEKSSDSVLVTSRKP